MLSRRRSLLVAVTGSFALAQLFFLHAHHFTDHLAKYGDTHPAEIHASVIPVIADHDGLLEAGAEGGPDLLKLTAAKLLAVFGFVMLFAVIATLLQVRGVRARNNPPPPLLRYSVIPFLRAPPR